MNALTRHEGVLCEQRRSLLQLPGFPEHFWFAYPDDGFVLRGATGDTPAEAVARMREAAHAG